MEMSSDYIKQLEETIAKQNEKIESYVLTIERLREYIAMTRNTTSSHSS
jgi:flagellar biosynthesis chaperone FliJ